MSGSKCYTLPDSLRIFELSRCQEPKNSKYTSRSALLKTPSVTRLVTGLFCEPFQTPSSYLPSWLTLLLRKKKRKQASQQNHPTTLCPFRSKISTLTLSNENTTLKTKKSCAKFWKEREETPPITRTHIQLWFMRPKSNAVQHRASTELSSLARRQLRRHQSAARQTSTICVSCSYLLI